MEKEKTGISESVLHDDEDRTKPFYFLPRKGKRRYWLAALLVLAIVAALALIFKPLGSKKPEFDRIAVQLKINEIVGLEAVVRQEKRRLLELVPALNSLPGLEATGLDSLAPSAGQLAALRTISGREGGAAFEFLSGWERITGLKKRIADLEATLGNSTVVKPGDTHFQVAYDFLIKQAGQGDGQARELLLATPLQEPLLPEFKIWNYWFADGFISLVTQGGAGITPEEATRQFQQKQREEKERALGQLNTLNYLVGAFGNLQERGILTRGFLQSARLGEVKPEAFRQSLDLRSQRRIAIIARALGLERIGSVTLFPREFKEDVDYRLAVGPRGRVAQLRILKPESFRNRRIVIAVE